MAADAPILIAPPGSFTPRFTYTVPGTQAMEVVSVRATFDGSGAGSDFLAALSIYAQSGELLSRVFPQTPVTAGDSAGVTFAPFPGGLGTAGGSGIRFDVHGQESRPGGFLEATTHGGGVNFSDSASGPMLFQTLSGNVTISSFFSQLYLSGANTLINGLGGGVEIGEGGGGIVQHEYGGGNVDAISDGGDVTMQARGGGGSVNLYADPQGNGPNGMSLHSTGRLNLRAEGNECSIASEGAFIHLRVWPGQGVRILDQNSGTQLFRFEYGGDLHMKIGSNIIKDLP